eukprot:6201875-Pleurochrysis_carterae.AAC.1
MNGVVDAAAHEHSKAVTYRPVALLAPHVFYAACPRPVTVEVLVQIVRVDVDHAYHGCEKAKRECMRDTSFLKC